MSKPKPKVNLKLPKKYLFKPKKIVKLKQREFLKYIGQYPKVIKIGNHKLPVHYYQSEGEAISLMGDEKLFEDGPLYGCFSGFPFPKILIDGRYIHNPNHPIMTILHECIEAINDIYGLGFTEQTIRCLEVAIYGLLADNPRLLRLLKESCGG
jgi:hypothetical protein